MIRDAIRFPATSCTGYSDRRCASLDDMEDIALVLRYDVRTETGSPSKDIVADTRANIEYAKKTFRMPPDF